MRSSSSWAVVLADPGRSGGGRGLRLPGGFEPRRAGLPSGILRCHQLQASDHVPAEVYCSVHVHSCLRGT
eukprot:19234-Prymnesium_polylepis.1